MLPYSCREQIFLTKSYAKRSVPIQFYGRVVDQDGKPIADATVDVMIRDFNAKALAGSREYTVRNRSSVTTDASGRFSINSHGIMLFIERVSAPGFLTIPEESKWPSQFATDGFRYYQDKDLPYYLPDKMNPAVFPLRREGEKRSKWPSRGGIERIDPS
jgi:hypothetical protein